MSCHPCSCLSVTCVFVAGEMGPSSAAEPPTAFHCDWHNHRNGCIMASLQPIPCLGRPGGSSCDKRQHHMWLRAACGEAGEGRDLCISCAVSAGVLPAAQAATVEQPPAEHAATADYSSPTGRLLMALHVEMQRVVQMLLASRGSISMFAELSLQAHVSTIVYVSLVASSAHLHPCRREGHWSSHGAC